MFGMNGGDRSDYTGGSARERVAESGEPRSQAKVAGQMGLAAHDTLNFSMLALVIVHSGPVFQASCPRLRRDFRAHAAVPAPPPSDSKDSTS